MKYFLSYSLLFDEYFALQTIEMMNWEAFHTLFTLRHMACDLGDAILDFTFLLRYY